jgi:hypothetical protein
MKIHMVDHDRGLVRVQYPPIHLHREFFGHDARLPPPTLN